MLVLLTDPLPIPLPELLVRQLLRRARPPLRLWLRLLRAVLLGPPQGLVDRVLQPHVRRCLKYLHPWCVSLVACARFGRELRMTCGMCGMTR